MHRRSTARKGTLATLLVVATLGRADRAWANDPAAAQALYDDARKLMGEKRYAEACPKLQESERLDPGVGTQFALADCYEQAGKIATAWAGFLDVVEASKAEGRPDRALFAKKRADDLVSRLPRLIITVQYGSKLAGLVVARDGQEMGSGQIGVALPVDPGRHEIVATAPGRRAWRVGFDALEATTARFDVPKLEIADAPSAPATAATVTKSAPLAVSSSSPELRSGLRVQKTLAIVSAGAGVAAIGVGAYFGLRMLAKRSDSRSHCDTNDACDATGLGDVSDGKSAGNLSTLFFSIGAAALAGGVALWITAPTAHAAVVGLRASPLVAPGAAGLSLQGGF